MEKKVLVVEDEKALLSLYASIIKKCRNGFSFDVYRAGNFEEAMLLSEQHLFDVLLTDYHLPGKDGIHLIKTLKQKNTSLACIIISGYLSPDIAKAASDAGVYSCLKKPCSIEMITGTIEEALNYQRVVNKPCTGQETIPFRQEVQCLIDNYPTETAFIDNTLHINAVNSLFKKKYPEAMDSPCFMVFYGHYSQCPECPLLKSTLKKPAVIKRTMDQGIPMLENLDVWYDRDGIKHGYIISCVPSEETDDLPFSSPQDDAFLFFAVDDKDIITYADQATTQFFSNGDQVVGSGISRYLHSYFVQLLRKENISFAGYAEKNIGRQVSLDFITKDSIERRTLRCELRINNGIFPADWKVIVIAADTASKNDISRMIEFGKETFQQLKNGQFDMVFTIDRDLLIKTANRVALSKLGVRHKDILGKNIADLFFSRRDTHAFRQAINQVQTFKNVYNLRLDIAFRENKIATLINMSAVRDSYIDEMGYVLVCHDIERQLRMETTLQSIERMRALGQLAAGIAHQINNYTNAIFGATDLLKDTLDDLLNDEPETSEEVDSYMDLIRRSITRLTGLTKHLTTFARAQQPLVISSGNVNNLITDLVSLISSQTGKKEVELKIELGEKLPDIPFSPLHLEQALLNIIMNSLDAVPQKTGRIGVITRMDDENIFIIVSDNGPGISPEIRNQLFEAFVTTKPAGIGTGLGLNIAKNVVESLKGEIVVESDQGGTTMTIKIPIHNEEVLTGC